MSRVTPSASDSGDETPTPGAGRNPLRADAPAVRLGIGRFTVDLVAREVLGVLAAVGRGVGTAPTVGRLAIGAAAALVELADTTAADRTAWGTQLWPLTSDPTEPRPPRIT